MANNNILITVLANRKYSYVSYVLLSHTAWASVKTKKANKTKHKTANLAVKNSESTKNS